jgi:outer membrane lipoprotein carrier protein
MHDFGRRARALSTRACLLGAIIAASATGAAADGVKDVSDYLRGLNALQADFRQITIPADGGAALEASGTFYLLRPNRFLWEYDDPSTQRIVADGKRIYMHDTELNQVTHRSQKKILDGTPAQLLASREPPEKYFRISNLERGDDRTWAELIPKTRDTDVEKLQIGFIDGELDTLLMEDRFGQLTRFVFTDVDRNPQLQYSMFEFKRPRGADFLQVD